LVDLSAQQAAGASGGYVRWPLFTPGMRLYVDGMIGGIDLFAPSTYASGHPTDQYAWLRDNDPVHWHEEPAGPGFWAVTRHEDVKAVSRDAALFSSRPTIMIDDGSAMDLGDHTMMLTMDPPRHTRYRKLVAPRFLRRAVGRMRPEIERLAAEIIDSVADRDEFDLVEDVAGLLPSYVIAELLGIPRQDGVELYRLTETIHADPASQPEGAAQAAVLGMFSYASGVWNAKRARPGDDLASALVTAEVDGHRLDETDFSLFFLLLVDAGGDTTRNLVAGGMDALFEHPGERERLTANPGLLPAAIEEMLRWTSPVIYMRRTATADTELGGRKIEAGQKVVMYYGAANRDPRAFDEPERFDVARTPNDHVAFGGGGQHFCLGAQVARVEIETMFRQLLTRLPGLRKAGQTEWLPSTFISGPRHLPVRHDHI
jgi:cytochrome P450